MSQGYAAKLLMDASTFDANSEPYAMLSESLKQTVELDIDPSIRGTRSRSVERSGVSLKRVGGAVRMRPSPSELDNLLPRILGAAEDADEFALDESLPEFNMLVQRVGDIFQYNNCKIATARFSASEGQAVELEINVIGKTRTKEASFPSVAIDTDGYYSFWQGVLTLNSATYPINSFEVNIDNSIEALFENTVTASTIEATDRIVTLSVDTPFTAGASTLQDAIDNGENIAGSLVFTNGNQSLTFTFNALMAADEDPTVGSKNKIRYPITFQALRTGSSLELVVTHDSTT
jgi:hypothetical protein